MPSSNNSFLPPMDCFRHLPIPLITPPLSRPATPASTPLYDPIHIFTPYESPKSKDYLELLRSPRPGLASLPGSPAPSISHSPPPTPYPTPSPTPPLGEENIPIIDPAELARIFAEDSAYSQGSSLMLSLGPSRSSSPYSEMCTAGLAASRDSSDYTRRAVAMGFGVYDYRREGGGIPSRFGFAPLEAVGAPYGLLFEEGPVTLSEEADRAYESDVEDDIDHDEDDDDDDGDHTGSSVATIDHRLFFDMWEQEVEQVKMMGKGYALESFQVEGQL